MNHHTPIPGPEFSEKDADQLIASYGQKIDPEKKTALMAKLEKERRTFEKRRTQQVKKLPQSRSKEQSR